MVLRRPRRRPSPFANHTEALAQHGDGRFPPDGREVVEDHVEPLASREVREENVDRGGGALEARLTVSGRTETWGRDMVLTRPQQRPGVKRVTLG